MDFWKIAASVCFHVWEYEQSIGISGVRVGFPWGLALAMTIPRCSAVAELCPDCRQTLLLSNPCHLEYQWEVTHTRKWLEGARIWGLHWLSRKTNLIRKGKIFGLALGAGHTGRRLLCVHGWKVWQMRTLELIAGESTCGGIEKIWVGKSRQKEWSFKFGEGMSKSCQVFSTWLL